MVVPDVNYRSACIHGLLQLVEAKAAEVVVGFVGTVIGFIVALSGVKPDLSASVDNVAPMVSTLINGMSIALYTTLIGAVLHVWLMTCYRMLSGASMQLYDAVVGLGECHVSRAGHVGR